MSSEGYEDFKYLSGVTIIGSEVNVPIEVKGSDIVFEVKIVGQTVTLDVNITNSVLDVNITNSTITVVVQGDVYIKNATDPDTGNSIPIDINITGSSITLDVNIVGSVTINVNVSGVDSGVVFNVQITGSSVTFDVNIASSSVTLDINIKSPLTDEGYVKSSIEKSITLNVSIQSQAVTLDVNIASQSVNIGVVIKSSEVTFDVNVINSELNVNVGTFPFEKASENILENPGFETGDLSGWSVSGSGTVTVQSSIKKAGSYAAKIVSDANQTVYLMSKNMPCQPGQQIMFTGYVYKEAGVSILRISFLFRTSDDGHHSWSTNDFSSIDNNTWTEFKIKATVPDGAAYFRVVIEARNTDGSSAVYVDSLHVPRMVLVGHSTEIPVNINIAGQEQDVEVKITGQSQDVNVNITGQSQDINVKFVGQTETLNINIESVSSGVTFNVNVTNATLNVEVQGTASVSIDNATVYLNVQNEEWARDYEEIKSDNGTVSTWANVTNYLGVWFKHGCRGVIRSIKLYLRNTGTADETVDIVLQSFPGAPEIARYTITVTAGDTGSWYEKVIHLPWFYDQLLIRLDNAGADIDVGVASGGNYNGIWGYALTEVRKTDNIYMIRATIIGSAKDIPVTGTVNTINIPNIGTGYDVGDTEVPAYSEYELASIQGMGKLLWATIKSNYAHALIRIYADGSKVFERTFYALNSQGFTNANFGVQLIKYDTSTNDYRMIIGISIPFKRELKIAVYNGTEGSIYAAATVIAEVIS